MALRKAAAGGAGGFAGEGRVSVGPLPVAVACVARPSPIVAALVATPATLPMGVPGPDGPSPVPGKGTGAHCGAAGAVAAAGFPAPEELGAPSSSDSPGSFAAALSTWR